jgi:hypothetical protein
MELEEKVRAVEEVFEKLDREIASFQTWPIPGLKNYRVTILLFV